MVALIERKKNGGELTDSELRFICDGVVRSEIPDYQLAAWLMAVCLRGMSATETLALTRSLVATGETLDWSYLGRPVVDKHSTGGVGDKTSLVLVPLMAAAGLPFVKMSGRGLGHTGGTLDKLESIPGLSVALTLDELRRQVERVGCALVGQSAQLVPADGMLYALRDVTATVQSIPLIASSIMSKKLAGGADAIVLDVKYGSGAFLTDVEQSRELARTMVRIGVGAGRRVSAVLSPMEEPLGRAVGNTLEVREAVDTLRGEGPDDLWELTLALGTQLLLMVGETDDPAAARDRLAALRDSGAALARFRDLVAAQGGDPAVVDRPALLPSAPVVRTVTADAPGWVAGVHARTIADAALELGAGRRRKGDPVDPAVGIRVLARVGDRVAPGQPLAEVHAASDHAATAAERRVREACVVTAEAVAAPRHPYEVIAG